MGTTRSRVFVIAVGAAVMLSGLAVVGAMSRPGPALAAIAAEMEPGPGRSAAAPTDLSAVAFLAGSWTGEADGGSVEELWSRPQGTSVIGAFRWIRPDGTPAMFEMLSITREGDGDAAAVRLRLRHYSPTLIAKEEKDKPPTLRLTKAEPHRAVFEAERDAGDLKSVEYALGERGLSIVVSFTTPDREPLRFALKKQ